ncbi:MAG: acetolactate synthase large subunit [Acetobacteraceae bacterium]|jgi:acetolactate synthase-1/2/3 large subunit|nr:thiamine pyrophosphate binding protein [Rhodopila sp.]MEA2731721.1 acetolactate synthase large subunit [Acetobacteraceae bacterium]
MTRVGVKRRGFFSAVAVGGAASLASLPEKASAQPASPKPSAVTPGAGVAAAEAAPPREEPVVAGRSGSDFMVDVIRQIGVEYVAAMPGSSFRGLHESIINYGGNRQPELLTCLHEEISVAMAHGYAKVAGKPMATLLHGPVGLQHASMAIYNAWCDRVPVVMIAGNGMDATKRRPGVEWMHAAQDNAAIVRDFVKFDDQPASHEHFAESLVRGYAIAVTPPAAPVLIMADSELQERPMADLPMADQPTTVPRLSIPHPPAGDPAALAEAARLLAGAENPVIVVDRYSRTQAGVDALVALAEALQAPVVNKLGRLNMPNQHYLNQTARARALVGQADVILGIEVVDFWGTVNDLRDLIHRDEVHVAKPGARLISLGTTTIPMRANFQDFQRYQPVDIDIVGDGETSLPSLTEAVRRALGADRRSAIDGRGDKMRDAFKRSQDVMLTSATYGWDASPISLARVCAEIWAQIRDMDWALTTGDPFFQSFWPQKTWKMEKVYQFTGGPGGYGVGYSAPAAVGAALAHRAQGRFVVNIQGDGELMCCPGALWTAVHHKIPMLTVMHNNRAYHQELMHVQRMADRHSRGIDRASIGTAIDGPPIDYAKLAQSMGMWAAGPVTDPKDLGPTLRQAIDVVKRGEPALIDVVCQPR